MNVFARGEHFLLARSASKGDEPIRSTIKFLLNEHSHAPPLLALREIIVPLHTLQEINVPLLALRANESET